MKIYLNETENKIIELLKESPKAFTELKEAGGRIFIVMQHFLET